MKALFAVLVLGFSGSVLAAPFCAVTSMGKQCDYYDYQSCINAAGYGGACVANNQQAASGSAPFCVISAIGAQCIYYNVQQCQQAASLVNGSCAANR